MTITELELLIFVFRSCVSHASIEENEANFAGIRARGDKEFTGKENFADKFAHDKSHCKLHLSSSIFHLYYFTYYPCFLLFQ